MSYNDKEVSGFGGSPYFLYEFNTSEGTHRYTSTSGEVEWDGQLWAPLAIKHSEVKQSDEMSKNSIKITIPLSSSLAGLFYGWSPDQVVTLTLRRGHFSETEVRVYWKGRITSHKVRGKNLELSVESVFTSMRRSGARARFQRSCRHALYGRGCKVDKNLFAVSDYIGSISGLTLDIPSAGSKANGWFTGGMIELPDGSLRMIVSHVGSSITISRASKYLEDNYINSGYGNSYGNFYGGLRVTIYPGCDRTIATCRDKFNNLDNQGGFKWIPSKNPMGGSSIV